MSYQQETSLDSGLDLATFTTWIAEIDQQPSWRSQADREMDYCDGNQLDSAILQKMAAVGMPPSIEPLMGPTIDVVLGMEAKTRTDWRVIPDGDKTGDDVADALNRRLNQAERHSGADRACSDAYASQVKVGIGWVEVSRETDPFKFPFRCRSVHRNEIWWDFLSVEPDLSDTRYLIRRKWTDRDIAKLMFADQAELIQHSSAGWTGIDLGTLTADGGTSTGLAMAWDRERGWSVEEQNWRDVHNRRVCLFEVWYRVWEKVLVFKTKDGRVVEYDAKNEMHVVAVGADSKPSYANVSRMRRAWYMGPHQLHDGPSPYRHNKFPYVAFWGKREDRTGIPFGLARGMMYLQDEVNTRTAKMQWGLAAVRTTRTDGAVMGDDEAFRQEVARSDADIILSAKHMREPGAMFEVKRDFELNAQQYQRLIDARDGIKRTSGIQPALAGENQANNSGILNSQLLEQSTQSLADLNDNFRFARAEVGELLLSMLIEDMIGKEEKVLIDGGAFKDDRVVELNKPTVDPDTGITYLTNDVARTRLKVSLADVPTTPSFRAQQLQAMSEAFKASPEKYQQIMMPHLMGLLDVPNRDDIVKAIRESDNAPDPELEIKKRELDLKEALGEANVKKVIAQSVTETVKAMYSAIQAALQVASVPQVASIADQILGSAGMPDANATPLVAQPEQAVDMPGESAQEAINAPQNTSPMLPPVPAEPDVGINTGIEEAGAQV